MKLTPKQQTAFDTIIECINSKTPVLLTGFAGTGARRNKVWRKELKGTWSRKAHRAIKLDKVMKKQNQRVEE